MLSAGVPSRFRGGELRREIRLVQPQGRKVEQRVGEREALRLRLALVQPRRPRGAYLAPDEAGANRILRSVRALR